MGRIWSLQSTFNRGQLDPRLIGRKDLQAYYSGAQTLDNVLTLVQGGIRRRNGTEFIASGTAGRLFNFSFSTETNYCLLFTDFLITVFKDGVQQTTVVTPFNGAELSDLDYIQSADTALVLSPLRTQRILSRTSDTVWSLDVAVFTNAPEFDFNDTLSPTPVSAVQRATFTNTGEGDTYRIALEGILSDNVAFAGDDNTNEQNIRIAIADLFNTGGPDSISVSAVSTFVFDITFSDASAKDWDLLTFTPVLTNSTAFKVTVVTTVTGTTRKEPAWSFVRGWPQVTTFHEGRLWFGRTTFLPATVWASKVNQFFDFTAGKARDDESISVTLDTDQVNAITGLFSNRTLQIFTSGGEFAIETSPITPANIAVLPQTYFGTKKVRQVSIDGVTLFVQRTGKAIRSFFFVNESRSYNSSSVSVLASNLINDPVDLAVSRGTSSVDANYAYIVNADGSMAVYNSLVAEDVEGFTQWTTAGQIQSVAVVDDLLYTYTKRTIGGGDVFLLEREDPTLTTDSSASSTSTDTLTGLGHLEGEEIDVIADGSFQGKFIVSGGEAGPIDNTANLITGGLNFTPIIDTMPLNIALKNGPNAALPKRIVRAGIELFESNGVLVNGQRIANKTLGVDVFEAPIPITGLERIFLQGYSVEATLTITQEEPMPMTILAVYLEVSV